MSKTDRFWNWLNEDEGSYEPLLDISEAHDAPRAEIKARRHELDRELQEQPETLSILRMERKGFGILYSVIAITSCLLLIGVLLYTIANLPLFGQENPRALEVTTRYVEDGLADSLAHLRCGSLRKGHDKHTVDGWTVFFHNPSDDTPG